MAQTIPKNLIAVENNWQKELSQAFTDPKSLLSYLNLPVEDFEQHFPARKLFPMRVPVPFASRIEKGNWNDPLLRQVMPLENEFENLPGYSTDPLDEQDAPIPGLLHKYLNRALLIVRTGCAVNCRYCFRRHFPYADNSVNKQGWMEVIDYLTKDSNINEAILSGGDPLMANDEFIDWLITSIEGIPSISRLRIHTRLPVVIPNRLTPALLNRLASSRLNVVMVLHINHANEVDDILKERLNQWRSHGITLLNQAVLLKGVNDSADAQVELSDALFDAGILPYYLHLLDKVEGAAHFDVEEDKAREIMKEVIRRQPGYLVPKLVREIGGQPGKTPIDLQLQP